jgi:hypothetical protein
LAGQLGVYVLDSWESAGEDKVYLLGRNGERVFEAGDASDVLLAESHNIVAHLAGSSNIINLFYRYYRVSKFVDVRTGQLRYAHLQVPHPLHYFSL